MSFDVLNQPKFIPELVQIKSDIEHEIGLSCELIPASISVPISSLSILFQHDEQPVARTANIMFLPIESPDLETIKLLQLHAQLPVSIEESMLEAVRTFLLMANSIVPIGAFSLNLEGQIAYKYVYSIGILAPIVTEEFIEIFLLWMYTLNFISRILLGLTQGEISLDTACMNLG